MDMEVLVKVINSKQQLSKYLNKYNFNELITYSNNYELELCSFLPGEYMCRTGDEASYIYFFLEGKAKVYTTTESGKSLLFTFYQGFDFVGDVELMINQTMVANVECITSVMCMRISTIRYRIQLLNDNRLLRTIAKHLAVKLNRMSNDSAGNLLYPLENRLAAYIVSISKDNYFNENLVQTAELLGASYRHLLRCMKKFCELEYMNKQGNGYYIKEYNKLCSLGENVYQ